MVGRLPIVTGSPASGRRGTATDYRPFRSRLRSQGGAAIRPDRAAGSRRPATPPRSADARAVAGSNFASTVRHAVPSIVSEHSSRLARRPRLPPPAGSTEVTSISRPASRTSNPGSPPASTGASRGESADGREQREVRLAEPAEHLADHAAQLAGARGRRARAAAARCARRPSRRRSSADRSACRGRSSTPRRRCRPAPGLCGDRQSSRERHEHDARDDRSTLHFTSALIAAGGSNVAGSTCVVLDRRQRDRPAAGPSPST